MVNSPLFFAGNLALKFPDVQDLKREPFTDAEKPDKTSLVPTEKSGGCTVINDQGITHACMFAIALKLGTHCTLSDLNKFSKI